MDQPLNATQFHTIADATLTYCFEALESAYDAGLLEDLELQGGILSIVTATRKTLLLTKHAPTHQLWLASPTSGGLHFIYSAPHQDWRLADNTRLYDQLQRELAAENTMVTL
jgi:iron donor protein CyaY